MGRLGIVRLRRGMLLRCTALQGVAALCAVTPVGHAFAQPAPNAHPLNPTTQLGSARYSYNGTTTTIDQSSQVLATGWRGFDVGSKQSVQINQPSKSAISVNRVQAGDPSQIAGHINANGVFVLVNPSGVVFSQGAQVNANSVIVSTADVANKNLAAGKLVFDVPGKPGAMVVNKGNISVAATGLAALVAPGVANAGVISAPFGRVALAGGEASVVDLYGDGLMSIDVTKQVRTVPKGPDGKPVTALVTNTGVITAQGGRIELTAKAVDGIVTNLVDAGGKIAADTAPNGKTGEVVVNGIGGSLTIDGDISAAGKAPGTKGGAIELNASNGVNIAATARVNASGQAGGGVVAVGTTLKRAAGGPSVTGEPTAKTVTIAQGARIAANATRKGNGGRVTVLSTGNTDMAGTIAAMGGAQGGDGGLVEVSGEKGFSLTGDINTGAPMGATGTILLDPNTLIVVNGGTGSLDGSLAATGSIGAGTGGVSDTVSNTEIDSLTGNIILQAGTLLQISDNTPITLKNNANLTLESGGDILVGTSSDIHASATGSIVLNAGTTTTGGITLDSSIITDKQGSVTLQASGSIAIASGITIDSGSGITLASGGSLSVGGLVNSGSAEAVLNAGTSGLTLAGTGTVLAGGATLAGGSISLAGEVAVSGALKLIGSVGTISETTTAILNAGTLTGSSGGDLALVRGSNSIGVLGDFAATGSFALVDAEALTVLGSVSGSTLSLQTPGLTLGSGTATAGVLTATGGLASIQTGSLVSNNGTVSAGGSGTIEFAPAAHGDIIVLGSGGAGTLAVDPSTLVLTAAELRLGAVHGTTVAGSISIDAGAGPYTLPPRLDLEATGAVTESAPIGVGTLTGSVDSAALTAVGNHIGTIGNFAARNGFSLVNAGGLIIGGTLNAATGTVAISDDTSIGLAGLLTATAASLTAASIQIGGTLDATEAALFGTVGAVTETGALNVGTLSGSAQTTASLTGSNAVGTLGSFSAADFLLNDGSSDLTVAGTVTFANSATVITTGSLSVPGAIAPSAPGAGITVGLTAGPAIDISGLVSDGGSGSTALVVNGGSGVVTEGGTLIAGTLTGTAAVANLAGGANAIGTLASFTSSRSLVVVDSANLVAIGTIGGGSVIALQAPALQLGDGTTAAVLLAPNGAVGLRTDALNVIANEGTVATGSGTIEISGISNSVIALGVAGSPGTLGLDLSALQITANTLRLGSFNDTPVAASIEIDGATNLIGEFGTLDLRAIGGITQSAGLSVSTLIGSAGSVTLTNGANNLGTLGAFSAGNGFTLFDAAALTVSGLVDGGAGDVTLDENGLQNLLIAHGGGVTGADVALTGGTGVTIDGSISTPGTLSIGLVLAGGVISEPGTAFIGAGTLAGGGLLDFVSLLGSANAIGAIANFSAADGFTLNNTTSLAIDGLLDVHGGTAVINNGSVAPLSIGGTITAVAAALTAGAITEDPAASVNVGSLTGSVAGTASLQGTNTIGTLGTFTANSLLLNDIGPLTVSGLITGGQTVAIASGGALTVPGSIVAAGGSMLAISLSGTSLSISGLVDDGGAGQTGLFATSGNITDTGSLVVGTLTGSAAVANLTGPGTIAALGSFSADTLFLSDKRDLAVTGVVSIGTQVALSTTGSIDVAASGSIQPASGTAITVGLTASGLSIEGLVSDGGGGATNFAVSGGTIAESPSGTVVAGTLDTTATDITLAGSANAIRQLTVPTFLSTLVVNDTGSLTVTGFLLDGGLISIVADNITVPTEIFGTNITLGANVGALNLNGLIEATGSIQLGGAAGVTVDGLLAAASLTANGGTASVALSNTGNAIGTIAGSAGGTFSVQDDQALTVGDVNAGSAVSIVAAGSLLVSGSILPLGGNTAISVGLTGTSIGIDGEVSDGGAGTTSLIATAGPLTGAGTVIAGTLSASGTTFGLTGQNTIAALGTLSNFSSIVLNDAGPLSIVGPISATTLIDISAATLTSERCVAAQTVTLAATAGTLSLAGSITVPGNLVLSGSAAVDGAGVTLLGGSALTATSAGGFVDLSNAGNVVASVSGSAGTDFAVHGGPFLSVGNVTAGGTANVSAASMAVTGTVAAPHATLVATAGSLAVAAGGAVIPSIEALLSAPNGLLAIDGMVAPAAGNVALVLNGAQLAIGGLVSDGGQGSTALTVPVATGAIGETGTLIAGTLTGSAAVATLDGVNQVGTLGDFTAPLGFSLADGEALTVAGSVASSGGAVTLDTGTQGLSVPGVITGAAAFLTAGSIDIAGSLGVTGLTDLVATQGSLGVTGVINTGTLAGSVATTVLLSGTNMVGTLGNFTAPSGFSLIDGRALTLAGTVLSTGGTIVLDDGTFALGGNGAINGLAATLSAGQITLGGSIDVAGVADLIGNQGAIVDSGAVNAGTLTGSAVTTASFTGPNRIGTLAAFSAPDGFSLADSEALAVDGVVSAPGGTIVLNTGTFGLDVAGAITALAATLVAGSIDLPGSLGVTGAADLVASMGSIAETGSLDAGTLTGSAATTATFSGSNRIGTLAGFIAGSAFSLADGQALTVTGVVSSGGPLAIDDTGGLNVLGTIAGGPVLLSAADIDIAGQVGSGAVTLVSAGSISAPGVILAASLQGSAASFASLTGANQVAVLNAFTAPAGFTLNNGEGLSVAGAVSASAGVVAIDNGAFALDVPGGISGVGVTLGAGTIGLTGSLGAAGVASLTASTGGITEAAGAFLNAGTLTGGVATAAAFGGTNGIGTLGPFNAPSGFSLADGTSLAVAGPVTAAAGTITLDTGTFGLSVPGAISGLAATL
ncbi:MAG TPA: filamentous hemagglutinin N-terminal domain-containing protein, partial [Rhodopila sp.]|uniref:beta strand repeat-containing protein n=1 Tax=Rhodopila sp. TaxID=2480087 RepID=UPI002C91D625